MPCWGQVVLGKRVLSARTFPFPLSPGIQSPSRSFPLLPAPSGSFPGLRDTQQEVASAWPSLLLAKGVPRVPWHVARGSTGGRPGLSERPALPLHVTWPGSRQGRVAHRENARSRSAGRRGLPVPPTAAGGTSRVCRAPSPRLDMSGGDTLLGQPSEWTDGGFSLPSSYRGPGQEHAFEATGLPPRPRGSWLEGDLRELGEGVTEAGGGRRHCPSRPRGLRLKHTG